MPLFVVHLGLVQKLRPEPVVVLYSKYQVQNRFLVRYFPVIKEPWAKTNKSWVRSRKTTGSNATEMGVFTASVSLLHGTPYDNFGGKRSSESS
jgi:hypothetical protein